MQTGRPYHFINMQDGITFYHMEWGAETVPSESHEGLLDVVILYDCGEPDGLASVIEVAILPDVFPVNADESIQVKYLEKLVQMAPVEYAEKLGSLL